jgi:hypothetical protein
MPKLKTFGMPTVDGYAHSGSAVRTCAVIYMIEAQSQFRELAEFKGRVSYHFRRSGCGHVPEEATAVAACFKDASGYIA